jgi:hypothetical protein
MVDRASDSTAGDVAVVMIFLFLHVDGEEREALGFCCWVSLEPIATISRSGSLA